MINAFFTRLLASTNPSDWINNLTFADYAFGIGMLLLFAAFVAGIVIFVKIGLRQSGFEKKLSDPNRRVRIVVINAPRQEVTSFSLRDINKKRSQSLPNFYATFPNTERVRLTDWINSILNGTNNVPYFLINYQRKNKRNRKSVHYFLRLVSADPTTGIIHLESYLVDKSFRTRTARKMLSSESELAESLRANGSASGMTFCFKLFEKQTTYKSKNKETQKIDIDKKFIDYVSRYAVGNQKVLNIAPNEVAIANFSFSDLSLGLLFALEVIYGVTEQLNEDLGKNAKSYNQFQIKCGLLMNKDCLGNSDIIIREVSSTVNSIAQMPQPIAVYEKVKTPLPTYVEEPSEDFDNEITRLIQEKRISYTFRPIYDVKRMKIYGYISRFTPVNSSFSTGSQMKNYAVRTGCLQTLLTAIIKNTIPKFVSERSNKEHRLFFRIQMDEREVCLPILLRSRINKETNLFLTFIADDIQNRSDSNSVSTFIEQIETLKAKGIKFAMVLKSTVLDLDPRIYDKCDAFLVDLSSEDNFEKDAKIRSELHVLVEGLLKYKKPIIATNLTTWNIVEMVVRSGVDYISSDMVAPYEKMMKPLPSKSVTKLQFMKEGK